MYIHRKTAERVCMDIREELMTWRRGMKRPGHEITHLGGTPMDDEKSNVCPYQYTLAINFSLQTAMGGGQTLFRFCVSKYTNCCALYIQL
jgi:hypothetical protein